MALSNRRYAKFVIVTRSRSGSNFLVSLLSSHPNIVCRGEEFQKLDGRSTAQVWAAVFDRRAPQISHVGFKIFYYHPLDSDDRGVWDQLRADKDIRVIHLVRRNMLRTVLSRQIAGKTDIWDRQDHGQISIEDRRVPLTLDECVSEFEEIEAWQEQFRSSFAGHEVFELEYEDMTTDRSKLLGVQAFLGVRRVRSDLMTSYTRQNRESLPELILNYRELASKLSETRWAYLLDLETP